MCGHKPLCFLSMLLVVVGALNWGLVGLGGFLQSDLNVVHMLVGTWPTVEWIVYLLVGLAGLGMLVGMFKMAGKCPCGSSSETNT